MLNSTTIGNKIATARKKINLSQAELSQKVSISPQAVGKWERGESVPDIMTLNRLAEIFGVDLNYFSEDFSSKEKNIVSKAVREEEKSGFIFKAESNIGLNWDMSQGNWADADFSGLKKLKEKFSSSNMKNCKFRNSELSGLTLSNNNIELCDFDHSDLRNCQFKSSNILSDIFTSCSFIDALLTKNNIGKCDFSRADFSGAEFLNGNFENNKVVDAIWKITTFKNMGISEVVFEGALEDCHFENCSFYKVKFQNAVLTNCFFKYNRRMKKVEFINCKVDKLTYAFLKNNQADLTGITVIE